MQVLCGALNYVFCSLLILIFLDAISKESMLPFYKIFRWLSFFFFADHRADCLINAD